MSVALQSFDDSVASTLLRKGNVGLGPLMPDDTGLLFLWTNDIATTGLDLPYRPMDGIAFSNWLSSFASDPTRVLFVIRVAERQQAVGFLTLTNIHSVNRCADIGIRIGAERDRGAGNGTAAVSLGLSYAWDHLNLMRVQLHCLADNARAIGAYQRAGFVIEGYHTHAAFIDGTWHDMLTMAALNPRESAKN
jgi:RimJ/RimL family protein N-acetyltransferase